MGVDDRAAWASRSASRALLLLRHAPTPALLYFMVAAQGMLGYGLTSVVGAIPADIFQGPRYGSILRRLDGGGDRRRRRWSPG